MDALKSLVLAVALIGCGSQTASDPEPSTLPTTKPLPPPEEMMSEPEEYRAKPVSVANGRDYFMRTGVGDPYAAGFPYPVFMALMKAYPDELGGSWSALRDKFGMIEDPKRKGSLPVGFHLTTDPNTRVKFLMMNCQICHTDRIRLPGGDKIVPGMGNKRLRMHAYDKALMDIARDKRFTPRRIERLADQVARDQKLYWPGEWSRPITYATVAALKKRAARRGPGVDQVGVGLPGRTATIAGFVTALNFRYDAKLAVPKTRGWVKIPDVAVWRYRETNSFDGLVVGAPVAMVAGADFAFGVRETWYDTHRHIATSMFLFLRQFSRRLPYPGTIDRKLASRGYAVFTKQCSSCHGMYSNPANAKGPKVVSYTERVIDQDWVGTDRARLDAVTDEFVRYVNKVPATVGLTWARKTNGYVPRPLLDVWARGLYGHNGQWPSLTVLAMTPEKRPKRFAVDLDGMYDVKAMGLKWTEGGTIPKGGYLYDASKPGHGVGGHPFLSKLPAADRGPVLEYLKTL